MAGILKVDTIQNANADNIITQTNSTTLTIGASGDTVTLAAGATSSGFGATYNGAVNWDTTAKTTTVTAASGVGYFINTTSGAVTVNLPAGSAGSIVALTDYAGTWQTNNVTVNANGTEKIGGVASAPVTLNTRGQAVNFVYVDSTRGWVNVGDATYIAGNAFVTATGGTITTCGDFKIHSFTGPGTFTVTNAGTPAGSNSVEYLVVAGGGGGGSTAGSGGSGGGGAGGFRQNFPSPTTAGLPVSVQGYPITVGGGGPGGVPVPSTGAAGVNGNPSIFSTITSTGGGGGAGQGNNPPTSTGNSGGSGGGGAYGPSVGGAGNTPPVSPSQGNNGGGTPGTSRASAGGGGAGATGGNGPGSSGFPTGSDPAGAGGVGSPIATTLFGPTSPSYGTPGPAPGRYFAGGGGGSVYAGTVGAGGSGGGGAGGNPGVTGVAGTANTGGGGGSGGAVSATTGGAGGSGIVVIRYKFQ